MIRPGGVPQARHTFRTSLSEGGPINTKNALETLGPSERGPVSSRPLVSGFPVLLLAFVERRLHAVCCCIREQYLEFYERHVGKQNHDVELAELVWAFLKDKNR